MQLLVYVISLKCLQEHSFYLQKMSDFVPNKVFLRGVLLHYFNITQNASESRGILVKVYGEQCLAERTCNNWFKLFKINNCYEWNCEEFDDEDVESRINRLKPHQMREKEEVDPDSEVYYFTGKQIIRNKRKFLPEPIPTPEKLFLRIVLLHYFNMKKNASECHSHIQNVYGWGIISERTCQKWYNRFKSGNFNLEDRERFAPAKKFEVEVLQALLCKNSRITQKELAKSMGVTQQAISQSLKAMGMIRKEGKWVSACAINDTDKQADIDSVQVRVRRILKRF